MPVNIRPVHLAAAFCLSHFVFKINDVGVSLQHKELLNTGTIVGIEPQGKKRDGKRKEKDKGLHVERTKEGKGQMMNSVLCYRRQRHS